MITEEEVKHIAGLAKLKIEAEDISRYQHQLTDILGEVSKIIDVAIEDENIMISPSDNSNCYNEDVITNHISKEEAFKNAKHRKGDYIVVPKVIE